jgi:hypothetical protein
MLRRSFGETLVTPFRVEPPPATAQSLHRTSEKKTQQGKFSLEISTEIPEHASCDDLDWSAIILQCQSLKEKPYHCSQTFCISSAPDHDIQIEVINIQAIANSPCRGRLGCTVPGRRAPLWISDAGPGLHTKAAGTTSGVARRSATRPQA